MSDADDHFCMYGCLTCLERKARQQATARILIARAVQTCWACPSQWDAWTDDGDYLYLRYRWGAGTVDDEDGTEIRRFDTGDPFGGSMSLDEFCGRAGLVLADDAEALGAPA